MRYKKVDLKLAQSLSRIDTMLTENEFFFLALFCFVFINLAMEVGNKAINIEPIKFLINRSIDETKQNNELKVVAFFRFVCAIRNTVK